MTSHSKGRTTNSEHSVFSLWDDRPAKGTKMKSCTWWRHQMEIFSALLALCAGNSPVSGEIRAQRPVTRSFDVFIDLRLNKRLSKQWWSWWFETPSRSLWRHSNELQSNHRDADSTPLTIKMTCTERMMNRMKPLSVFPGPYWGNPLVTNGSPFQRASDGHVPYFHCC